MRSSFRHLVVGVHMPSSMGAHRVFLKSVLLLQEMPRSFVPAADLIFSNHTGCEFITIAQVVYGVYSSSGTLALAPLGDASHDYC